MIMGILIILVGIVVVVISRMAPIPVNVQRVFDIIGVIVAIIGLLILIFALFASRAITV